MGVPAKTMQRTMTAAVGLPASLQRDVASVSGADKVIYNLIPNVIQTCCEE
jgi:hypothetical protein